MLADAKKDPHLISSSWHRDRAPIEGLIVREVLHVPGDRGVLTEIFRPEWDSEQRPVGQVFQIRLYAGQISAWHCHLGATDRLFVSFGQVKLVLFDDREGSPTRGTLNEFHIGEARPTLLIVPPGVWHGVQNLGASDALMVNCPSDAYDYDDPDHWRVNADCSGIPYSWKLGRVTSTD